MPGRGVRLERVATRGDELLLQYADGRARVWDMRTYELRRSIGQEQADALVADAEAKWWSLRLDDAELGRDRNTSAAVLTSLSRTSLTSTCVVANLRRAIEAAANVASAALTLGPQGGTQALEDQAASATMTTHSTDAITRASPAGERMLAILRPLLMQLLPLGLDRQVDTLAEQLLGADWTRKARTTGLGYFA